MLFLEYSLLITCLLGLPTIQAASGEEPAAPALRNHVVFVAENHLDSELSATLIEEFQLQGDQLLELVIGSKEPVLFPALLPATPPRTLTALEPWVQDASSIEQALGAGTLLLRGGSFMDWYELASPEEFRSYLPRVLRGHAKAKKNILVFGGGCAFLSGGVLVPRHRLKQPIQRNPRLPKDAPEARVNLSLGPGMMFGSDSWPDSSPLRLLRSMHDNQLRLGAYFIGQVAMDYDRSAQTLRVLGPGHLLLFDLTRARIFPDGIRGGRLSSLGAGDLWKVGSAPILMAPTKIHGAPEWTESSQDPAETFAPDGAGLIRWLTDARPTTEKRSTTGADWTLGWDERSRRQASSAPGGHRTWIQLPFDCRWPKGR